MSGWLTPAALLALGSPALPSSPAALNRLILAQGWRRDRQRSRMTHGGGWEYHISLLPTGGAQSAASGAIVAAAAQAVSAAPSNSLWIGFERLSKPVREEAAARLAAIDRVGVLAKIRGQRVAVGLIAHDIGVSASTLWGWLKLADGVAHADRLPALAPRHRGRVATVDCDPRAWDFLLADYLRGEKPCFEACERRLREAAARFGWAPIPSAKTLKRRLEREVPEAARVLAREGEDALKRLYPAQTRDRTAFAALQAVNMDGHKLDVFCRFPQQPGDKEPRIGRAMLCAIQDLATGMVVGWNLSESENHVAVRLAIADMVEDYGIPEEISLDNGRGFATKWITGRQKSRYRFKIKDEDQEGVLTALGVKVHWTTPYSGQSKPIERAFRDLTEEIARHPLCAGAYTGNSPAAKPHNYGTRAIDFAELEALVAREIERHNHREGRRGNAMNGRSFARAYADRLAAGDLVRRAGDAQRRMLLLASEAVKVRPTADVYFADNRYWSEDLIARRGTKVVLRFDPRALFEPMAIFDLEGRFVCQAECIEATGFNDVEAARIHAKARRGWMKAQRTVLELERRLTVDDLIRMTPAPAPMKPEPPALEQPNVLRLTAGGRAKSETVWDGADAFARAMAGQDGATILPFSNEG